MSRPGLEPRQLYGDPAPPAHDNIDTQTHGVKLLHPSIARCYTCPSSSSSALNASFLCPRARVRVTSESFMSSELGVVTEV